VSANRFVDALAEATASLDESKTAMNRLADQMEGVTNLVETVVKIQDRQRKAHRARNWIIGGIIVGLVALAGLSGLAVYNAARIGALQDRTSDKVFCPLYKLFIDTQDRNDDGHVTEKEKNDAADSNQDGNTTDKERMRYDDQFQVIFDGYELLECRDGESTI
jgi:hypothetical protein